MATKKNIYNDLVKLNARDKIMEIQGQKLDNNRNKIKTITKDLLTVRRQVEIQQDSALKKSNYIFLLKTILTYLIVIFILLILSKQGILPSILFTVLSYLFTILVILVVGYNLKSVYYRDNMKFDVRDFDVPNMPNQSYTNQDDDDEECPMPRKTLNDLIREKVKGSGIQSDTYEKRKTEALVSALNSKNKEVNDTIEQLKKKQNELIRTFRTTYPAENIEQEEVNTGILSGIKQFGKDISNQIEQDFSAPSYSNF